MKKSNLKKNTKKETVLPNCRGRSIAGTPIVECLEDGTECIDKYNFEDTSLCKHPLRQEIVKKTKKQ